MKSDAVLLYRNKLTPSDLHLMKIINFMGGSVNPVQVQQNGLACEEFTSKFSGCLVVSAQTLTEVSIEAGIGLGLRRALLSAGSKALVYGFEPIPSHNRLLQELTSGGLIGAQQLKAGGYNFQIAEDSREICGQLTGLSFRVASTTEKTSFIEGKETGCSSLIWIEEWPFFVDMKDQYGQLFLLANTQIADLDAKVLPQATSLQSFPDLAPVMMFMRCALANQLWHNDQPTACFIVDDPLLKKRYGFLEYHKLFDVMQRNDFSASIAFIPWNYRRSSRRVANLFATYPNKYSLCVHGCDHTAEEFGGSNYRFLREQALKALERMGLHHQLSGLPFDDVMVFPQGVFSSAAMKALKSSGYLAAVNSTAQAIDCSNTITLRDLVDVAVTRFSNFPLFIRRYPASIAESAFDLFLGKPALLVEHHTYFRDGYHLVAECIDKINSLDKRLEWTSLASICTHTCLRRVSSNGDEHVKFFTNRFWIENDSERPKQYVLHRQQSPEDPVTGVTINGRQANYTQAGHCVKIFLPLVSGQGAEVRVQFGDLDMVPAHRGRNATYSARVFVRRCLSEFRDNYVDTNSVLRKIKPVVRYFFAKSSAALK